MTIKKFTKKIEKNVRSLFSYIRKNYKLLLLYVTQIFNFIISIIMLLIDPVVLFTYLLFYNLYLYHSKQFTLINFLVSCIPILIFWYLVLVFGLADHCPLIIGPGDTEKFILKVSFLDPINPRWCERICLNTVILLDKLSCFLNCTIVLNFPKIF